MLDQSFSSENFRIVLDVVNRKGLYVESENYFDNGDIFYNTRAISNEITCKNEEIRTEKKKQKLISDISLRDYSTLDKFQAEKDKLKDTRDNKLLEILNTISSTVNQSEFKIELLKGEVKFGKQLYIVRNTPENFFTLKQIQRNFNKTFKVKQSDRKIILSQLIELINDGFPKLVLRTDIESFYESIPHKDLIAILDENQLLSYPTKHIVKSLLNQYWNILIRDGVKRNTDTRVGIPRGIGISAFLAELFMKKFDNTIKSIESVTFYARYVDDIVIIFTPMNRDERRLASLYIETLKSLSLKTLGLTLNTDKTTIVDLRKRTKDRKISKVYDFTYLGYKFIIEYKLNTIDKRIERKPLRIVMSEQKRQRYENKISLAFEDFKEKQIKYIGSTNGICRILNQRVKFLTNNYQLIRRKSNVFIGVYFSNPFLTEPFEDLTELDVKLNSTIDDVSSLISPKFKERLKSLSFLNGYKEKRILQFNSSKEFRIERLMSVWKEL